MTAISIRAAAASLAVLAATACTTTGVGTGQSASGSLNAAFNWTQTGGTSGTMTANLSNGSVYQGQFFEVTRETQVSNMGPLWAGWGGRWAWRGWGWWGPSDSTITHYSGQVLANLQGPAGYMRCHFTLASPSSGMDGGGSGECQHRPARSSTRSSRPRTVAVKNSTDCGPSRNAKPGVSSRSR